MKHSFFQRCAWLAAIVSLASLSAAQAPGAASEGDAQHGAKPGGASSESGGEKNPLLRPTPTPTPSQSKIRSPHGPKTQGARVVPAADLAKGEIQVLVSSSDFQTLQGIEGQDVKLFVSQQSIERGNRDTVLTERTDARGRVTFPPQPMETDHIYKVSVTIGEATFSSNQFQFRSTDNGLRVILPIFPATDSLDGLLLLSRAIVAFIPQDELFAVDFVWRVENYSDKAWTPKGTTLPLPDGFRALTIRNPEADARFEPDGDRGVKFAGTFTPGQHDLMFRFHLPTYGEPTRTAFIPTGAHLGSLRVILDGSPSMTLNVEGFGEPEAMRNQDGQPRLIASRDFLKESSRPPERIQVQISGIRTPPGGRTVAVSLAAALMLVGLGQGVRRQRTTRTASDLSKEDREKASELLLEELIQLERAFEQGAIGRKTRDQARQQLLEAYARLGAHGSAPTAA